LSDSRIPGLYRLSIGERIDELVRLDCLSETDAVLLRSGSHVLSSGAADNIIENVVATFGLPFAVAPNFLVDGRDYIVPLVVEEPSIVAAVSGAARLARPSGGFTTECDESLLAGQVHLKDVVDIDRASSAILNAKDELLQQANAVHPRLVTRGGGVREIEVRELELADGSQSIVVQLLVDTCDAMGANLVNTICEVVAPKIATLCGGNVAMSIISNLTDRSIVTARVRYPLSELAASNDEAATIRDAIVGADQIAYADRYRAATHNKGIMNGIDALAIATGNDWRAIEAGAHAFAARDGEYRPLTNWTVSDDGDLAGEIRLPLKIGIVGGTIDANPAAALGLRITGVESAIELAKLMAAVGLAQNFAAIRALVTSGIQEGHMRLHARSAAAKTVPDAVSDNFPAKAAGKVILLGEHAVVYGKHAVALPIPDAVSASVIRGQVAETSDLDVAIALIARELDVDAAGVKVELRSRIPRAMGLGSSAAIAVAITRGFAEAFDLDIDDERVNAIAFECEKLAHGTPSGVDNTIATYARPMLFRRANALEISPIALRETPPIVVAYSHSTGLTVEQVAGVRTRHDKNTNVYEAIFSEIDDISLAGAKALAAADYDSLGSYMNICHGLLNAIEVSTPELENMVAISRAAGAVGAKLTGAGGGGSIVAMCPGTQDAVAGALASAGFVTMRLDDSGERDGG
jgi:hydroxymethylglutaryl-CoA reductase